MSHTDDFPTLVSSLQASTVEWNTLGASFRLSSSGVFSGASLRNKYVRFMQVLQQMEELFSVYRLSPRSVLVAWCASLQDSGVAPHFVGLIVDLTLQGNLPHLALTRCLRLVDVFLDWTTRPNAGHGLADGSGSSAAASVNSSAAAAGAGSSCPVLIPSFTLGKWVEQTWAAVLNLSRDNAGTSSPTATAGLCGALQLLPVLLRWTSGASPLPSFRRGHLPHPVNLQSEEARLLAYRALPAIVRHQPANVPPQSYAGEVIEYVRRGCAKSEDIFVRLAAGAALRGVLEAGLRVPSPAVAFALMELLLCLCDDVSPFDLADEVLHDVGVAMGYLLCFYQSDFTADCLSDVLLAATPLSKAAGDDRGEGHRRGTGSGSGSGGAAANGHSSSSSGGGGPSASGAGGGGGGRIRWKYFGGSDAVEGSRVVQRCFNERMTRTAQRALATALATLCSTCATPSTTASVIQCCFVLLMPIEGDGRQYMPRLLADAIQEWARLLPSNGYRVVLADVLRGYVQRSSEDKAVVRTAMVALQGVARTLSSSLTIGFNVADDVLAAVNTTPSLLHTGVEVLGAVARTNTLYARQLQHQCARADSAEVANTISFQLHIRALLDASAALTSAAGNAHNDSPYELTKGTRSRTENGRRGGGGVGDGDGDDNGGGSSGGDDALAEEDRVSLVHVCIRLLLRLSRGDPPRAVQDIHYRQAELIFRLTQLIYDLLHGSPAAVLAAVRDELQPCTLGFMNLLVSSPAASIAFYKAVTAACAMLQRAPHVSDTERMLAVGFLEARLTSQDGVARHNVDAAGSSAATAYFAVSKAALYQLVAHHPWPSCKDDGSLRWLAAQALKDIARACAHGAPVFSLTETHGAVMARAVASMRLARSSLLKQRGTSSAVSAAAETPAHPLEECGSHAVRLLCWTLRHFMARGAVGVCVSLFSSIHTSLWAVYATPVSTALPLEEQARQTARREVALWNTLAVVQAMLTEANPAETAAAVAALWADAKWNTEVQRWRTAALELVPAAAQEAVEVRLLAARVVAVCLVYTNMVDVFTSQTVSAVAQATPARAGPLDSLGALMILCEAHSHAGEASTSGEEARPTLPLATSLLCEVWKRMGVSAAAATPSAAFAAPVLTLLSLRLAQVYPAEVEAALADGVAAVLLAPMSLANAQWWSPTTALGMLTAAVQLWSAFPGSNDGLTSVPQSAALLLVQESLSASSQSHHAPTTAVVAALDAAEEYTRRQRGSVPWRMLLHLCVEHTTHLQHEEECVPCPLMQLKGRASLRRHVAQHDAVSQRLARLWCAVLSGGGDAPLVASAVADAGSTRQLTIVEAAIQIDLATAAAVRREWVRVAQAMASALLPDRSTSASSKPSAALTPAFTAFLAAVHAILQSRSPDVAVDVAEKDADMFAAADDEGQGGSGGGGGGSGSDDAEDYAEDFDGDEGTGGILSETMGGASRDGGGGAGPSAAASTPAATAAALTFDVAAKEAVMWVLYGVLRAVGGGDTATAAAEAQAEEVRRALLPMVVAAAQLVEVHPEVQLSTIAVLHQVLRSWGGTTLRSRDDARRPAAVLLPWKTQLVVGLTAVLLHGLLCLEACTALAVQYSRCNLADTSSCRRVLRSLLTLLHACHRLQERRRVFLLGGSSGAGHIIVAVAKVAQSPAMLAETLEAAQGPLVRTLASPPCQAALTLLCERFVTAVSLANGYVQPTSAFLGWAGGGDGDDDGDGDGGASATSSVFGARMSVTAGDVLQAIAFLTDAPLRAPLGPALRYATGCLACLVLVAHTNEFDAVCTVADARQQSALQHVALLSPKLTAQHQRTLAQLSQQRLLSLMGVAVQKGEWGERGHGEATLNGSQSPPQQQQMKADGTAAAPLTAPTPSSEGPPIRWDEVTALLSLAAASPMPPPKANTLLRLFKPLLFSEDNSSSSSGGASRRTEVVASLLCVALAAQAEPQEFLPLLSVLSVDAVVSGLPPAVSARLEHAACAYVRTASESAVRAVATAGPAGLALVCRCATLGVAALTPPPLSDPQLWPCLLRLLHHTARPVRVLEFVWSPPPAAGGEEGGRETAPLRDCAAQHPADVSMLLALFASLPSATAVGGSLERDAALLLHCGPLMCELLLSRLAGKDTAAAVMADGLHTVLAYVVAVLTTKLGPAYALALNEVGRYLVRTVAPAHGAALREAIQRLGAAKAGQLRAFMEASCN